jgi:hypothetical protein
MLIKLLKLALKSDSFDVCIVIKIPFFRVFVTIGPSRSLLIVRYIELFDTKSFRKPSLAMGAGPNSCVSGSSLHAPVKPEKEAT